MRVARSTMGPEDSGVGADGAQAAVPPLLAWRRGVRGLAREEAPKGSGARAPPWFRGACKSRNVKLRNVTLILCTTVVSTVCQRQRMYNESLNLYSVFNFEDQFRQPRRTRREPNPPTNSKSNARVAPGKNQKTGEWRSRRRVESAGDCENSASLRPQRPWRVRLACAAACQSPSPGAHPC